jgi:PAS domain S-box-containing protein
MAKKPTYEELEQRVRDLETEAAKHKQVEQLLRQQEAMLKHIVENLPVMFAYIDANERYLFANKKFEKGFKQSNVVGKTVREVVSQDRYEEIKPEIDAVLAGKAIDFESRGLFEKGDQRYFRRSFRPEMDESGNVKGYFALIYDITEIKLFEKALKESEEKFRVLVEAANKVGQAITLHQDKDGIEAVCVFANDVVIQMTGYTREELAQISWLDIVHPSDREAAKERYRRRMQGKVIPDLYEITIVRKDGTEVPIEIVSVKTEFQGKIALATLFRDNSERNRTSNALRESEERMKLALEGTDEGIWDWDVVSGDVYYDDNWIRILGYEPGEIKFNFKWWDKSVHPESKPVYEKALNEYLQGNEKYHEFEYQMQTKSGEWKCIWARGICAVYDDQGKPLRFIGTHRDITKRKRAEEALRESEKKYRTLFENANEAIYVVQDGKIKFPNPKTEALYGYSAEEMTSKHFTYFIHEEDREIVRERSEKRLRGEIAPNIYSYRVINKAGNTRWIETNVIVFPWEGRPAILCFLTDITERHLAEEELRNSEGRTRALLNAISDSAILINPEGIVDASNTEAAKKAGVNLDQFIGKCLFDFFPRPLAKSRKSKVSKVLSSGKPNRYKDQRNGRITDINIYPVFNGDREVIQLAIHAKDITEHVRANESLKKREQELRRKATILEETNTALNVLLKKRETDKIEVEEKIIFNVKELIEPYLIKLKNSRLDGRQQACLSVLESGFKEIVSPFLRQLTLKYHNLTPKEIRIAGLIKEGKTTKEIAELQGLTTYAIDFHRKKIREKLNLINRNGNLQTHLLNIA